jgi:two-component system nitrogen regulation response regulator GlnG
MTVSVGRAAKESTPDSVAVQGAPPTATGIRLLTVGAEGTESESAALALVREWAAAAGVHTDHAPDLPRAIRRLALDKWNLVFAALSDRSAEELAWWADVLRRSEGAPRLVALVQRPSMALAMQAQKLGVLDLLSLALRPEDFDRVLQGLRGTESERAIGLPHVDAEAVGSHALVGQHPTMLEIYKLIVRVAPSHATVLLQGDSGSGKEVVARAIHQHGANASGPFVAVNCAAIPENLLESELFGHEKGAFTGAMTRRTGRFELAVGGTLFLDEVADMSLALQAKILRAVQEREIERVGGGEAIPVDVRLVAATNRDLREAIADGKFREDLYYRLAIVTIDLPRLSERGDDLLLLAAHFAQQFGPRYGKNIRSISDRALELLRGHEWKGNVRELRNVIERAVVVATDETLRAEHLPAELRARAARSAAAPATGAAESAFGTLAESEASHIARVLAHTNGAHGAAAEILGIHRNTLARKLKEYGL